MQAHLGFFFWNVLLGERNQHIDITVSTLDLDYGRTLDPVIENANFKRLAVER